MSEENLYGESIRKKRVELEIPMYQMAESLGKGVVYYSSIERGLLQPTPVEKKIISEMLGL